MELLWVRHGEPERIAPGTRRARRSRAHRARARAGRAPRRLARARADRRGRCRARSARAVETAAPIARAHGLEVEVVDGLDRVRLAIRPLHPDGGAARDERRRAGTRWSKAAGRSSAANRPTCSAPASTRRRRRDRRRASRAAGRRGVPRRRDQRRARDRCSASTATAVVRAALHVAVADGRVAHRHPFGRDRSTSSRTSTRREGAEHDTSTRRARRTGHDRHDRPARACATRSTGRPRPRSPTRSAPSTPTTTHDVAILTGAGGTFCAGADLKAIGDGRGNAVHRRRRRTDGPDAHAAREAGDRRGRGLRGRGRARARAVVRPARRRARRGVRRVLPAVGRAARRRRHRPPAAPDRPLARARPDPHRPRRERRRSAAHGPRQPADRTGRRARRPRSSSRTSSRALPQICLREDRLSSATSSGALRIDDAMRSRAPSTRRRRCASGESLDGRDPVRGGRGPPRRVRRRRRRRRP